MDERTWIDSDGVSHIERRTHTCAWHETNDRMLKEHECRIQQAEKNINTLIDQNGRQFQALESINKVIQDNIKCQKRAFDAINNRLLAIAGGIIMYLLYQLGPWG